MRRTVLLLSLTILVTALAGCSPNNMYVARAVKAKRVVKPFNTYKLSNGVTLVLKRTRGGPSSVQLWVRGGSRLDPPGKSGLAHMVEHGLFAGSTHTPPGKAGQYIEEMGGRLSGNTGLDFSYFGATIPGPGWRRAFDILFDLAAYPTFDPALLERERKVVLLEIGQSKSDAERLLLGSFFKEAYRVHPYHNPSSGLAVDIPALTRDDIVEYYSRNFIPSNMVVVVVGDVDPDEARDAADSTFGRLSAPKHKRRVQPGEPDQLFGRTSEAEGPVGQPYMAIGWHVCEASSPDIYALEVLRAVLGQGRGARLFMELRERGAMAYEVQAELFALRQPGVLVVLIRLKDDVQRVKVEVLRQINKLKDETVSAAELKRAINSIESSHLLETEPVEGQAYSLGYWYSVYGGDDPAQYMENIRKVTPEEVRRVAQRYLGEGSYTMSVIRPERP